MAEKGAGVGVEGASSLYPVDLPARQVDVVKKENERRRHYLTAYKGYTAT